MKQETAESLDSHTHECGSREFNYSKVNDTPTYACKQCDFKVSESADPETLTVAKSTKKEAK